MTELHWRDELLFDIHSKVERHGFAIQHVMGERDAPSWGYTIGLLALGHPELIVFGLDAESTAGVLHRMFDEIAAGTFRPVGRDAEQVLGAPRLPMRLLPVPDEHWDCDGDRLCIAVEYYDAIGWDRSPRQALQLVWATPSDHFPWDAGCSARFRRLQPLLDSGTRRAA
jgi:hypothetical protein